MVGAYAGNRLGAVRDAKGKSVAAVFSQLGGDQKAQVRGSYSMFGNHDAHGGPCCRFYVPWLRKSSVLLCDVFILMFDFYTLPFLPVYGLLGPCWTVTVKYSYINWSALRVPVSDAYFEFVALYPR